METIKFIVNTESGTTIVSRDHWAMLGVTLLDLAKRSFVVCLLPSQARELGKALLDWADKAESRK